MHLMSLIRRIRFLPKSLFSWGIALFLLGVVFVQFSPFSSASEDTVSSATVSSAQDQADLSCETKTLALNSPATPALMAQTEAVDPNQNSGTSEVNPARDVDPSLAVPQSLSPDIQRILDRGKLIVATRGQSTPPFVMYSREGDVCPNDSSAYTLDDGSLLCGLDITMGLELAAEMDVDIEFNTSRNKFNEVTELVAGGQADVALSKLSLSFVRAMSFGLSNPYVTLYKGLLVNRVRLAGKADSEDDVIRIIRSLDENIGVIANTQYGTFAREAFPKATVQEFPTWEAAVAAVTDGTVMAAFRDELEVKRIVLSDPASSLRLKTAVFTDTDDKIVALVSWKDVKLLDLINTYFDVYRISYSADDLIDRYSTVFSGAS